MNEIKLFNNALNVKELTFKEVNEIAVSKGYVVHPECCNYRVLAFLATLPINHNSTFYNSWDTIKNSTRLDLYYDQIRHYASTYGTNHTGEVFIPNSNPAVIDFVDCKVILPITQEDILANIQAMLDSGIAMQENTIVMCVELINEFDLIIDVNTIKNKEVMMHFHKKLGTLPTEASEMVRYLVFCYTDSTLLIKDAKTVAIIKQNPLKELNGLIYNFGIDRLAPVFHRFKPLFLAMKKDAPKAINRLRRSANRNHKPFVSGYWQNILSDVSLVSKLQDKLQELNNYKKVVLLETIKVRMKDTGVMPVRVRNGKLFVTERKFTNLSHLSIVYDIIYTSLVEEMKFKACSVKLPKKLKLAVPSSEKAFIGNIPFGSYVNIGDHVIIGINWKGADGAQDLDLSLTTLSGNKIGWNDRYSSEDKKVLYSGDMTSAHPEATELMYCANGAPDCLAYTNLYNGSANSKYTLFIATEDRSGRYEAKKSAMVDPNNIIFSTELSCESEEQLNGMVVNNKYIFNNFQTGDSRVSSSNEYMVNYTKHMKATSDCMLDLEQLLLDAGFTIVTTDEDLDLSNPGKNTLIELLAKQTTKYAMSA